MDKILLQEQILRSIKKDMIFENPRSGTSTITKITPEKIVYTRGSSRITLNIADIICAYQKFAGENCSSVDLRKYKPKVFDSKQNGHSCNCTFLFTILNEIGLTEGGIQGEGKAYKPYYVKFK